MTATVVTLTLCATRQADAPNVGTALRAEIVTTTSTSATTTPVTNMPIAATQLEPTSVSAMLDTHSTIQPSVKVCCYYVMLEDLCMDMSCNIAVVIIKCH